MKIRKEKLCAASAMQDHKKPSPIITDPQGCYTGRPIEKHETPVQDVDDL